MRRAPAEKELEGMTGARIAVPLGLAVALAIAAITIAPRAYEAQWLIAARDDPAALADYAVAHSFNAAVAEREINAALAANDADLARSFLDLAQDHKVPVDPALSERVRQASADAGGAAHSIESFARGLVTGEPEDLSGLAGTAVGDLFVFGDIRDAAREGARLATGQQADELILGLACVGLAVTAGTYVTVGLAAPARVGLTVVKAAGKTGRIGGRMMAWIGRSLREIIDWSALTRAVRGATVAEPAVAVRASREAVKVEKAQELVGLVGDVGRVQGRAGTQAAFDGLRLAQGPRDMSRIARLAATKGGKTRAILKLAGRGAILLTLGTFNLAMWIFWAVLTLFGIASSLKRMTERATERYCARRKVRRARILAQHEREERERCAREQRLALLAASAEEPTVIYSTAPALVPSFDMADARTADVRMTNVRKLRRPDRLAVVKHDELDFSPLIRRPPWPWLTGARQPGLERGIEPVEKALASFRAAVAKSA
jgi:hypothetical protein